MNDTIEVTINGEKAQIPFDDYQRLKKIAKSRKSTLASAISYCLEKVAQPRKK